MKIPFHELEECRAAPVDWQRLLNELHKCGITGVAIASLCGRSDPAVNEWKNRGTQPRYKDGATIIALHRKYCGGEK